MKRWVRWLVAAALVLVLVTAPLAWLLGTRSGLEFAWRQVASRLGYDVQVGMLDGRLLGPMRAANVTLDAGSLLIEVERLEMDWHPMSLLRGRFDVERLAFSGVDVTQRPAQADDSESSGLPDSLALPVRVDVRSASIDDLRYFSSPGAAAVAVDRIALAAQLEKERWRVEDIEVASPYLAARGRASLVPGGDYSADAALDWTFRWPGHPEAHGETRLSGDLDRLTLRQTVEPPYRVDAEVALSRPLSDGLLEGRLDASVSPGAVGFNLPFETIGATADLGGRLSAVDVVANASLAAAEEGNARVALDATYSSGAVEVRQLEVSADAAQRDEAGEAGRDQRSETRRDQRSETEADQQSEAGADRRSGPGADQRRGPGRLTLAGKIALEPETDVALAGEWQNLSWPLAGTPVFASPSGTLRLSGAPETLTAELSADVGARGGLSGTVRRNGEQLAASLEWHDLFWPVTGTEPTARSREGKLGVEGVLDDYRFTIDTDLALGSAVGTLDPPAPALRAAAGGQDGSAAEGGQSRAAEGGPNSRAAEGGPNSRAAGSGQNSRAAGSGQNGRPATAGHLRASGTGSLERLDFAEIEADVLGGTITGTASAAWEPSVSASADLTAKGLNPGMLDKALEGRLDARIEATAALEDGAPSARVTKLAVDGSLRGRAVHADAVGRYAENTLALERLDARSGRSELHAAGTLGESADLTFAVDSPDLGDFWPNFAGKLEAHGSVRGPRTAPLVAVEAAGDAIRVPQASIDDLMLRANVDVSGMKRSMLELEVENATLAGTPVASLNVSGAGDARAHSLSVAADTDVGKADLALTGGVEAPGTPDFVWRFELERATVEYPSLAPWSLENKTAGRLTSSGVVLEHACWQSGDAQLCLDVAEQQGAPQASLALTALPFEYFAPLLPEAVSVAGELTATAEVGLPKDSEPVVDVMLHTTPGHIARALEAGASAAESAPSNGGRGLTFGAAEGHIVSNGTRAAIDLRWPFERQGQLDLHAVVERRPGEPITASTIGGEGSIEVRDLSFVPNVVDEVDSTGGTIVGDVVLSGTLAAPRLEGRVALEKGRAVLIGPGITLENVELAVVGDGTGRLEVEGRAESGGGRLAMNGDLRLEGATPVGRLNVTGDKFQVFSTSAATVFVSPDLRLEALGDALRLDGTVRVPSASITPQVLGTGAVSASPDQVILDANGEPEGQSNLQRPLSAKIALEIGDDVSFAGYGLTADLGGALTITERPGEPTTGTGEVRIVRGTYTAYGQMLNIRRGRLTFAGGPITRPGLDIEAVRQATTDILVGARVRGTLAAPELSLFSEPPLPQQEQLSYLVLGRSLDNTSSSETSALQNAAIALGLKGGNAVSERLNRNLGFQEFGIETTPGEGATSASFVIGRYLTPSLYVSYGVGLFQPVNTLTLRFAISSRWRLVTESSSQTKSGDLIYHIERGD